MAIVDHLFLGPSIGPLPLSHAKAFPASGLHRDRDLHHTIGSRRRSPTIALSAPKRKSRQMACTETGLAPFDRELNRTLSPQNENRARRHAQRRDLHHSMGNPKCAPPHPQGGKGRAPYGARLFANLFRTNISKAIVDRSQTRQYIMQPSCDKRTHLHGDR